MSSTGRVWSATKELIDGAYVALEKQHPQTLRQLFYALVTLLILQNDRNSYQRLSGALVNARESGKIPWEWITDRSRTTYPGYRGSYRNLREYADSMTARLKNGEYFTVNHWTTQPNEIEVWCEKDATTGSFTDVTSDLGVTVRTGRGQQSATIVRQIAEYYRGLAKPIFVFYLGDFDASGMAIERSWTERVREHGVEFEIERLAIHKKDISEYDLPPLRIKTSDSNAQGFRREFGTQCVELDALPVAVLRERVRAAIIGKIDMDAWKRAERRQQQGRKTIREKWSGNFPT